jgi:hypothetical protein
MMRIGLLPAIAIACVAPLAAQQVNPAVTAHAASKHGLAHYGKWLSAAAAITLTGLGAHEYASSDDAYRELRNICRADATRCAIGSSGSYTNAASEDLYQASIRYARRARVRLLAGQASLLLAAGLFLADHGRRGSEPGNIPYHLTVESQGGGARVGVRVNF